MAWRSSCVLRSVASRLLPNSSRITTSRLPTLTSQAHRCRDLCQGFSSTVPKAKRETVTVYFVMRDGTKQPAKAKVGDNLLDVIVENDVDIDGFGACEGTLSCSTCHLIFKKADFESLPDKATDEELDMLDLAFDLTDTSRLGCQVIVEKKMEGWEIHVPAGVSDARG